MPAPHQKKKMHPQDQRNLLIFALMFGVIYLVFDSLIMRPYMQRFDDYHKNVKAVEEEVKAGLRPPEFVSRDEVVRNVSQRVTIANDSMTGSIDLRGGRIDDILLREYYETLDDKVPVSVMSPVGTHYPRYADFGWLNQNGKTTGLPDKDTLWTLTSQDTGVINLEWNNGQGLVFARKIETSDRFLIKVTQTVTNETGQEQTLFPYALISEHGLPGGLMHTAIVHEGPLGFINGQLEERDYDKMPSNPQEDITAVKGWIGFTEHYWLTAILPQQTTEKTFRYAYTEAENDAEQPRYQIDVMGDGLKIEAGATATDTFHIFAGAKELWVLEKYSKEIGVDNFDNAIDFGWFWFLTKPFLHILLFLNHYIGHFAATILVFAGLLRICVFPLANTSFRSFAKLKIVSPKIVEIRTQYADDKVKMQQELIELYKREKVNPAAGCLPILVQIPIFFSLYKVLNIAIEMRHAPGFYWIDDLSAPDPTSVFNLFGLLPYDVPHILVIGALPCLMLVTMLLQKSMNPPPADPMQRDIFRIYPFLITFIMSGFAAGLVMYWTFNNILSITQQYIIMRSMGIKVEFFQGWFGREVKKEDIAISKSNDDVMKGELNETLEEVAEGGHTDPETAPKEISAPKPRKKKKK